jgi:hypothetical protein
MTTPMIDTDIETLLSGGVTEYCHLRRRHCPSIYGFCGEIKPWRHVNIDDGSWRSREDCPSCHKLICPKCYKLAIEQLLESCPSCGGPC